MKAGVQAERETLNYRVKREATRYLQEVVIHSLIHSFNTYFPVNPYSMPSSVFSLRIQY